MTRMFAVRSINLPVLMSAILLLSGCAKQPVRTVPVKIISIVPTISKNPRDSATVTLQTADGRVFRQAVVRARLSCRVGDMAIGTKQGIVVQLSGGECEKHW